MTDHRSNPKAISTRAFAERSDRWRPPHRLVGLVGGRWTLAVVAELADHGRRYQDLHDSLEGISHKVLTDTLRRAERDGLITRHLDPGRVDTATLYELTLDPTSIAVLAAYRADWKAFEQALATANPADPALAATMINPQLQGVKANLLADQVRGMIGRGAFTLHPKIVSISASTATVVDCAYSTSVLLYAKTGKPVPPITPPENDGVRAALVFTGGMWKVYKQTVTDGKCAPGS